MANNEPLSSSLTMLQVVERYLLTPGKESRRGRKKTGSGWGVYRGSGCGEATGGGCKGEKAGSGRGAATGRVTWRVVRCACVLAATDMQQAQGTHPWAPVHTLTYTLEFPTATGGGAARRGSTSTSALRTSSSETTAAPRAFLEKNAGGGRGEDGPVAHSRACFPAARARPSTDVNLLDAALAPTLPCAFDPANPLYAPLCLLRVLHAVCVYWRYALPTVSCPSGLRRTATRRADTRAGPRARARIAGWRRRQRHSARTRRLCQRQADRQAHAAAAGSANAVQVRPRRRACRGGAEPADVGGARRGRMLGLQRRVPGMDSPADDGVPVLVQLRGAARVPERPRHRLHARPDGTLGHAARTNRGQAEAEAARARVVWGRTHDVPRSCRSASGRAAPAAARRTATPCASGASRGKRSGGKHGAAQVSCPRLIFCSFRGRGRKRRCVCIATSCWPRPPRCWRALARAGPSSRSSTLTKSVLVWYERRGRRPGRGTLLQGGVFPTRPFCSLAHLLTCSLAHSGLGLCGDAGPDARVFHGGVPRAPTALAAPVARRRRGRRPGRRLCGRALGPLPGAAPAGRAPQLAWTVWAALQLQKRPAATLPRCSHTGRGVCARTGRSSSTSA